MWELPLQYEQEFRDSILFFACSVFCCVAWCKVNDFSTCKSESTLKEAATIGMVSPLPKEIAPLTQTKHHTRTHVSIHIHTYRPQNKVVFQPLYSVHTLFYTTGLHCERVSKTVPISKSPGLSDFPKPASSGLRLPSPSHGPIHQCDVPSTKK